jgi:hypothetical protein
MYVLDINAKQLVAAEIVEGTLNEMPLKKDGWNFNWRTAFKTRSSKVYILKLKSDDKAIQGALQLLKTDDEMLIMELLELAPDNVGKNQKQYDYVAGCLIAFACRESFKLKSNYKGFLTFESKTKLKDWYIDKYGAQLAMGQKMYIDPNSGEKLIQKYLNRKIK